MPFLRFSRDRRGYEHTYLVHTANRRGKPSRPRILYWYRTPPGVRVGRPPFDEEVRKTIEAHNPGVHFDWSTFASTTIPPAEPDPWWERRRAERAARHARRADDEEVRAIEGSEAPLSDAAPTQDDDEVPVTEPIAEPDLAGEPLLADQAPIAIPEDEAAAGAGATPGQPNPPALNPDEMLRRRRRRRGGRRRRGRQHDSQAPGGAAPSSSQPGQAATEEASPGNDLSEALDDVDEPAENDDPSSEG